MIKMTKTKYNKPYAKRSASLVRTKISDRTTLQRIIKTEKYVAKSYAKTGKFKIIVCRQKWKSEIKTCLQKFESGKLRRQKIIKPQNLFYLQLN